MIVAVSPLTLVEIGQFLLQEIDLAVGLDENALDAFLQQGVLFSRRLVQNLLKGCLLLHTTHEEDNDQKSLPFLLSAYTHLLGLLVGPKA